MAGSLLAAACSGDLSGSPTAPSLPAAGAAATQSTEQGQGLPMTPAAGTGGGTFNLTHTESNRGGFTSDAHLTVSVHGLPPATVLHLVRAGDFGLPGGQEADGVCQRAASGFFGEVPDNDGVPITLETSAGGAGSLAVHLVGASEGRTLDAVFRLVDALPPAAPTVDLRTPCFTFTVK